MYALPIGSSLKSSACRPVVGAMFLLERNAVSAQTASDVHLLLTFRIRIA
jgi:hypothetical protein